MPLLEVLTRCYKRPNMLAVNQASLARQTDGDWMQTLIVDEVGRGVAWANGNLSTQAGQLTGDYVWVLDDDDECIRTTFVAELRDIVAAHSPDVIMVKMDHGPLGVLPAARWGCEPKCADIGISAFVVKREVWQRHSKSWGNHYAGDFDFISAVFAGGARIVWYDVVASRVQKISRGAAE